MAVSSHEARSEHLFRKGAPHFFSGGPKPEKKHNPHEAGLRKALTHGNHDDIATTLTSFLAAELMLAASHRPSDKFVKAGMLVSKCHGAMAPDEIIEKIREILA